MNRREFVNPWKWIPTLYFAQGLPNSLVVETSVAMFVMLNVATSDIALYTSILYLPWVVKPLWSPFIDIYRKKRWWIIYMQFIVCICTFGIGFTLNLPYFFILCFVIMFIMAFASATYDIAADGFYMMALREKQQAFFVGVRSTFYRVSMVAVKGLIVILAGFLARRYFNGNMYISWSLTFGVTGLLFLILFLYHKFTLPEPSGDYSVKTGNGPFKEFLNTFSSYFKKPGIISTLSFILLFRLGEAQLVKIAAPFLLGRRESGGLEISPENYGLIYGTIGVIALLIGGIAGGILISRGGLKKWILPMVFALNVPNIVYVFMSYYQPESIFLIGSCVAIEQLGYGFGFTAYILFLIMFSDGINKTAHYAISTGFMALGMMLPGMASGAIQESVGYTNFFIWVMICTLPGFVMVKYIKIPENFGIK